MPSGIWKWLRGRKELQLRMSDKRAEVPVARKQERAMVEARLHHERIRQFRLVTQPDHAGAKHPRANPIIFC